jgi:hypothetical protein
MGLKRKQMLLRQKTYFEHELANRLSSLSEKGIESKRMDKDPLVRELKADVKAVAARLKAIANSDKITEDMAKARAAKAAAPAPVKEKAAGKAEKPKKAPAEAKEKKPKAEKKAAPPADASK